MSLDEESDIDDFDDRDLKNDTLEGQLLGYDGEDDDGPIVTSKLARVFKQGRLWSRNRDGSVTLNNGDIFSCKQDLLIVMKDFCVLEGFTLRKIKNDRRRYTQKCSNLACTWRIHASVMVDKITWMLRSLTGNHTCPRRESNNNASSRWVANHLLTEFRSYHDMTVEVMQDRIMTKFGLHIEDYTCWRAKKIMKQIVEGKYDDGYKVLPQYCEEFKRRNPESLCFVNWRDQGLEKNPTFKRVMIFLVSAIAAFKENCRPLIGIDACQLKGPYKSVLMIAMGLDGNNG